MSRTLSFSLLLHFSLTHTFGNTHISSLTPLSIPYFSDSDTEFGWTEEEVADLYDNTTFIIAADGNMESGPNKS